MHTGRDHDWPAFLAKEFCPAEEPIADEVARCYAAGGRLRRSVLPGSGEQAGGFGGTLAAGELAQVLDALAHSAGAVLAFLDRHQGIGTLVDSSAVTIALIQARRDRRRYQDLQASRAGQESPDGAPAPPTPAGPVADDVPAQPAPSPEVVALVDGALEELARRLAARGLDDEAAWARGCTMLLLMERGGPAGAAEFVRYLTRRGPAPDGVRRRWWQGRW